MSDRENLSPEKVKTYQDRGEQFGLAVCDLAAGLKVSPPMFIHVMSGLLGVQIEQFSAFNKSLPDHVRADGVSKESLAAQSVMIMCRAINAAPEEVAALVLKGRAH